MNEWICFFKKIFQAFVSWNLFKRSIDPRIENYSWNEIIFVVTWSLMFWKLDKIPGKFRAKRVGGGGGSGGGTAVF